MTSKKYKKYLVQTGGLLTFLILLTAGTTYIAFNSLIDKSTQTPTLTLTIPIDEEENIAEVSNDLPLADITSQENLTFNVQAGDCSVTANDLGLDPDEQAMAAALNSHRNQNGLPTLPVVTSLTRAAAWLANDVARNNSLSHTDSLGRGTDIRANDCGYPAFAIDIIVQSTTSDVTSALNGWKNSPGHNAAILNKMTDANGSTVTFNWQSMGVARAYGSNKWWWVAYFGEVNDGSGTPPSVAGPTAIPTTPIPTSPPATCDTAAQLQGYSSFQAYCAANGQCTGTPSTSGNQLSCPCVPCSNPTTPPNPTATNIPNPTATSIPIPTSTPIPNMPTATNIPPQNPSSTPFPSIARSINVEFMLSGVGSNFALGENNNPIAISGTLYISDLNDNLVSVRAITPVNYDQNTGTFKGSLDASGLSEGDYIFKLSSPGSLVRRIPGIFSITVNQNVITTPAVKLVAGDVVPDNILDIQDYNAILSCYGSLACSNLNKDLSDLNRDGKVDEQDINIFYDGLANRIGD